MGDRDTGDGRDERAPSERELAGRLSRLGERIETFKSEDQRRAATESRSATDTQGIARGFRLSAEFVAAVVVGGGIGWVLDRTLGIAPWGLIVFLMLGFAAGVVNVMRAAELKPDPGAPDR